MKREDLVILDLDKANTGSKREAVKDTHEKNTMTSIKKYKCPKVTPEHRMLELIPNYPPNKSHAALLLSITRKLNMSNDNLNALFNLLITNDFPQVTILLGGYLKRHNFWEKGKYNPKLDALPEQSEMDKEAIEIEENAYKEVINLKSYRDLENKIGKNNIHFIKWQDFLKNKNYDEIRKIGDDYYNSSPEHQAAFKRTIDAYLKPHIRSEKIHANHVSKAYEASVKFLLEEGPLLSRKVLDVDYLFYLDSISDANASTYKLYNKGEPERFCRWIYMKPSTEIISTLVLPVGYGDKKPIINENKSKKKAKHSNQLHVPTKPVDINKKDKKIQINQKEKIEQLNIRSDSSSPELSPPTTPPTSMSTSPSGDSVSSDSGVGSSGHCSGGTSKHNSPTRGDSHVKKSKSVSDLNSPRIESTLNLVLEKHNLVLEKLSLLQKQISELQEARKNENVSRKNSNEQPQPPQPTAAPAVVTQYATQCAMSARPDVTASHSTVYRDLFNSKSTAATVSPT